MVLLILRRLVIIATVREGASGTGRVSLVVVVMLRVQRSSGALRMRREMKMRREARMMLRMMTVKMVMKREIVSGMVMIEELRDGNSVLVGEERMRRQSTGFMDS